MAQSNKNFSESPYKRNSKRRRTLSAMRESEPGALPAYFQTDHKEGVLNALEAIETDVMLGKPIQWKNLRPLFRGMKINRVTAPDCLNFAKELLGLFERCHCKDIRVISDVFVVLLFITEPFLESPIDIWTISFYPYGKEDTNVEFVWEAARSANLGLLKLQLRFGMEMELPDTSFCGLHIDTLLSDWQINSDDNIREYENTADYEISVKNGIITGFQITEICEKAIEENLSRNFNPESMKRLLLVLRMLEMTLSTNPCRPDCREHFIKCYRLLFDSITAAFVTSVEVKATLEKCLPASCSRLISRIAQDFKNTLPEFAEVPQPRSLKHLCRIEVRKSLRKNLNLPSGVSLLPLPKVLKQYIMLNDDGDYSVIIESVYDPTADMVSKQEFYITIPERDDCVTSFLKTL